MTTEKSQGRNFTSRYSRVVLPDNRRCRYTKDYGITVCNDPAVNDVHTRHSGFKNGESIQGYCAFHTPIVVKRDLRQLGVTAIVVAR